MIEAPRSFKVSQFGQNFHIHTLTHKNEKKTSSLNWLWRLISAMFLMFHRRPTFSAGNLFPRRLDDQHDVIFQMETKYALTSMCCSLLNSFLKTPNRRCELARRSFSSFQGCFKTDVGFFYLECKHHFNQVAFTFNDKLLSHCIFVLLLPTPFPHKFESVSLQSKLNGT